MTSENKGIIEALKKHPLKEAPPDLTERVMARISVQKPSLLRVLWGYFSHTYSISFKPVYAFGLALLVCGAFFLGMKFPNNSEQLSHDLTMLPEYQAGMFDNSKSAYLIGRALLQENNNEGQALAFLKKAAQLEPQNPEFAYWEGVGYWSNGDRDQERRSYLRGLETAPMSIPLLINLGHNYLSDKRYEDALIIYQKVLALDPENASVRYNTGLIYRALGMRQEEISSWRAFLQNNRTGTKAFRALQRLNAYEDFTYRAYKIGFTKVIINQQTLLDDSLPEQFKADELEIVASLLGNNTYLGLEVVAFVENDQEAARKRAFEIRHLIKGINKNVTGRVHLSWFGVPEEIDKQGDQPQLMQSEGLLLFGRLINEKEREVSI